MRHAATASQRIKEHLQAAAHELGTVNPVPFVGPLLDRSFPLPVGATEYAANTLTPGAVPLEPSFSEQEPDTLRFTLVPLSPAAPPASRRDEATREMRRLVGPCFGTDALRWFDRRSEEWRGTGSGASSLSFGAYFGTAFDGRGITASKVYYELKPGQLDALPGLLRELVRIAQDALPGLVPVFTSIKCGRDAGSQRVTFLHRGPLRLTQLGALMNRLGLGHQLPGLMQITGLCLGGRFDLPERSVLIGLRESSEGPELKLEIMLGMIPDVPPAFLDLLTLGLSERPRELSALGRWLRAFTPEEVGWPGEFSVLSIRATQRTAARVNLYLRPAEYEVKRRLTDYRIGRPDADAPDGSTADGGSAGGGYEHGDYGDFGGYGGPMPAAEYRVTAGGRRDDHGCGCGTPVAAAQFGLGGGYGQALAALRDRGGAGPRRRF